ncbi:MAG: hypothetical protein LUD22_03405, partial [Coprobacillus sp.]|nr:hypothetical protein [Coprobacillus sp.]
MQDIYEAFEFDRIKEEILPFSLSEFARDKINNLAILSKDELTVEKKKLEEINDIIEHYSSFPLSPSKNAVKILEVAKKSGLLTPLDLMNIYDDIVQSQEILNYYTKVRGDYPNIDSLVHSISDLSSLSKEIKRCISPSCTILDNASKELKEIRDKIKSKEKELEDQISTMSYKYSSLLSDENATIRDSHFVLPIKTGYKNKIQGIVYDVSNSKNTTFIEPIEIVQINNELRSLEVEQESEERRILLNLTNLALLQDVEIIKNNAIIGELDFLSAKSKYGASIHGLLLPLSENKVIDLVDARHPLIDPSKVVPNTFYLDKDTRIIIISG